MKLTKLNNLVNKFASQNKFHLVHKNNFISESEEPNHDNQPVGGTVLGRLQAPMEPQRVWRG